MAAQEYRDLLKRYADYAPVYDRRWARYTAATLGQTLKRAPIMQSTALLDVACGTGLFASMALKVNPQLAITGVDVTPEMLEKAKQRIPPTTGTNVRWLVGRAESLPVEGEFCDLLTCNNAFHLVTDQPAALREFHRALEPGGTLVIVDWSSDHLRMRLLGKWLARRDHYPRNIRRLTELKDMVGAAGFTVHVAEHFKATWFWRLVCLVARKP